MNRTRSLLAAFALWFATASPAMAETATVAVASNFLRVAEMLAVQVEKDTGHRIAIAGGSSGALAARVMAGAPYDVLLSADADRPADLLASKDAVEGTTYALGALVFWTPDKNDAREALESGAMDTVAIANPALAPYGVAAEQALRELGLEPRLVRGENIGQVYALVASGAAPGGFVARSQIAKAPEGSVWVVPAHLHAPIRQDAVLLARGADNPAARAFFEHLSSEEGRAVIAAAGYLLPAR